MLIFIRFFNEAEAFCDMVSQEIHPSQPNYKTTKAKRHQRPISLTQAFELYQSNEFLKAILDTGAFRFVDGYFVINHEHLWQNSHERISDCCHGRIHR